MKLRFETDRLILRPIVETDEDDIFEYCSEPNVGPNAGWKPHEDMHETRVNMNMIFINKDLVFGMELKESSKLIGTIGLINDDRRRCPNVLMLGYAMSEKYWGKGLMTEAAKEIIKFCFTYMEIDTISVYCYPHNYRSMSVIKKLGFEFEGCLKNAELLYDGQIFDVNSYSLLKSKYLSNGF